jgi:hypothetical protein
VQEPRQELELELEQDQEQEVALSVQQQVHFSRQQVQEQEQAQALMVVHHGHPLPPLDGSPLQRVMRVGTVQVDWVGKKAQ